MDKRRAFLKNRFSVFGRIGRAGFPTSITPLGTSPYTTDPIRTIASQPIVAPYVICPSIPRYEVPLAEQAPPSSPEGHDPMRPEVYVEPHDSLGIDHHIALDDCRLRNGAIGSDDEAFAHASGVGRDRGIIDDGRQTDIAGLQSIVDRSSRKWVAVGDRNPDATQVRSCQLVCRRRQAAILLGSGVTATPSL